MKGTATRFNENGSLIVGMGNKQQAVTPSEIMYITGDSNYSRLILSNKSPVIVSITLSHYESILPGFIRIHKQYIVNPAFVKRLVQDGPIREGATVQLKNGEQLAVSRRRIKATVEQFVRYRQHTV